jgi:hypothetical protein
LFQKTENSQLQHTVFRDRGRVQTIENSILKIEQNAAKHGDETERRDPRPRLADRQRWVAQPEVDSVKVQTANEGAHNQLLEAGRDNERVITTPDDQRTQTPTQNRKHHRDNQNIRLVLPPNVKHFHHFRIRTDASGLRGQRSDQHTVERVIQRQIVQRLHRILRG